MAQERVQHLDKGAHAPQGSYWPIVLSATLTLAIVGLVSHLAIAVVGAGLSLGAMIAWAVEKFEGPPSLTAEHETVDLPAFGPGEADIVAPVEIGRSSGWWGLVWFIATEAVFFANLIAGYLYLRLSSIEWPPPDIPHRELLFPIFNTAILLLSGVPAYLGQRALARGNIRGLQTGFVVAAILGVIFLAGQGYEYMTAGFTPQTNAFAAGFYLLTGFHGAHVIAGVGLLLFVFARSLRHPLSERSFFAVEVASTYWHFVDIVWIFLFGIFYLFQ